MLTKQPNPHGVFDCTDPDVRVFEERFGASVMRIEILEVGPRLFAAAHDFSYSVGNYHSSGCGISLHPCRPYTSMGEALAGELRYALRHFNPAALHPRDSCVNDAQRKHSEHFYNLLTSGWPLAVPNQQLTLF